MMEDDSKGGKENGQNKIDPYAFESDSNHSSLLMQYSMPTYDAAMNYSMNLSLTEAERRDSQSLPLKIDDYSEDEESMEDVDEETGYYRSVGDSS